jgi:hypothetical protein
MNPTIPDISQLKELSLPAPVSYTPQTWGWWLLLALLVAVALLVGVRSYVQWRRDQYRREALVRLAQLRGRSDDLNALRELPELLKRVALSMPLKHRPAGAAEGCDLLILLFKGKIKRSQPSAAPTGVAGLGRSEWQAFLQQHSKKKLPDDFSAQLALLAYAPDATLRALPAEQRQALFDTCQHWVEHHHVAA